MWKETLWVRRRCSTQQVASLGIVGLQIGWSGVLYLLHNYKTTYIYCNSAFVLVFLQEEEKHKHKWVL